jgi:ribonuclease-3
MPLITYTLLFIGINILINIMSRMGNKEEVISDIPHNERLEFLGDAVVEFTSR